MGKICLVDLAGSEDNNLTGNDPTRMREVSKIFVESDRVSNHDMCNVSLQLSIGP